MTPDEFVSTCQAEYPGSPAEAYLNGRGHYLTDAFRAGWCQHGPWSMLNARVILPVYHPYHGELVAITGRAIPFEFAQLAFKALAEETHTQKYWNTSGFKKKRMIYGLPRPQRIDRPIAVVEGQLDVLALEYLGVPAYAVFGKNKISGWQAGLLRRISDRAIVWPDKDDYNKTSRAWISALKRWGIETRPGPYPNDAGADDPDKVCQRHADDVVAWFDEEAA